MLVSTISLSVQLKQNEAQSLCLLLWVHKISPNKKKEKKKKEREHKTMAIEDEGIHVHF